MIHKFCERYFGILHIETAKTCLEGNTHLLADVGNRGQAQRSPR